MLSSVISPDQSCGVKGRNPTLNNRLLQDIVSDLNNRGLGGAVLSLDQEKAFDRVDWGYLQRVLDRMNFGPSFCQWISLFYTGISSSVLVNDHCSHFFSVSRGVRQGCPLSPLLYIIIAETMACAIRADPLIDGFALPGNWLVKICQYADDTTIFVMTDCALCRVFEIFQGFELASGAKLNVTKSHGLLIGTWASRTHLPIALQWSSEFITVMGSHLANTISDESWKAPVEKLDSVLSTWRTWALSFHGRALIVNMMGGLSVLWYLASSRNRNNFAECLSHSIPVKVALATSIYHTRYKLFTLSGCAIYWNIRINLACSFFNITSGLPSLADRLTRFCYYLHHPALLSTYCPHFIGL